MPLRSFRSTFGRLVNSLGLRSGSGQSAQVISLAGEEMAEAYYDAAFQNNPRFHLPFYRTSYYPTWLVIVDRLRRYGCERILDVGCGPGQFASLIKDSGFSSYIGIDFSQAATDMARQRTPSFEFRTGDVRDPAVYAGLEFDAIVCTEVLEHVKEDDAVLSCFPEGTRCLMTVPNFPWRSHVRHFDTADSASRRYGGFFDGLSVTRLKGAANETDQFFLLDGVRNSAGRKPDDPPRTS
jgi:SAM-dependent methyltransferase